MLIHESYVMYGLGRDFQFFAYYLSSIQIWTMPWTLIAFFIYF